VRGTYLVTVALTILCGGQCAMAAEASQERAIRRSDVVFMYDNPKLYEAYGCTVLGWAGWPAAEHIRDAHAKGVRRFSCSVGFLTEFKRVIDFDPNFLDAACRNFAGEPFIVPWLSDHKHKDKPAYWWCTNSPLYRRYLLHRLEQTMEVKPGGLHIDDYRGTSGSVTWLEGGFCPHCMAAFRDYLRRNVASEELAKLGITDLATFDYRQFLLDRGVTPKDYKKRRASLPLAEEFHHFHVMANNAWVAAYRQRAEELRGQPVSLSVNSGANSPHAIVIAPELANFCCEVWHGAATRQPATHPVYIYKIGDGLDRPICSTAAGQDWAFVHDHKVYELVRSWAALSYAFGHTLMAPHRQWCYTKEKGTHWTNGPTEEYAWLYRWVRDNARLFDRYEAVAPVAVVYSNQVNRRNRGKVEPICVALARANVPFTVVIAGDNWLPDYRLTKRRLDRFKAVVVPKTCELDPAQQKLLDQVEADGRLVVWPDKAALAKLIGEPVAIEGAKQVWAVPRAIPGDRKAPVMVHLLNRNYDGERDATVPQKGLTLRLHRDHLGGRKFAKATLHAPKAEPRDLELTSDRHHTTVAVSELALWAIVELK